MANSINQSIQDFYQTATEQEFARDFSFRLLAINPGDGAPAVTFDNSDLVYIKTASLPERAITNVEVPYMGLKFNVPGSATYPGSDSWPLVFYADANSVIREKYEDWSRAIFDDTSSTGNYFTPRTNSIITLAQVDTQMDPLAIYNLVGVSVRSCGALNYNIAEGVGNTIEFTATIAYHYWTRNTADFTTVNPTATTS